jgi:hypothetical protein
MSIGELPPRCGLLVSAQFMNPIKLLASALHCGQKNKLQPLRKNCFVHHGSEAGVKRAILKRRKKEI